MYIHIPCLSLQGRFLKDICVNYNQIDCLRVSIYYIIKCDVCRVFLSHIV